jgi:membrane protein DedA with SNARE-associated domain
MGILASAPAPLPGFLNTLAGPLNHYGYWLILLLVLLEDFGVPVPGETVMIAGAVYAGHGQLNVVAVGVIAFVAAVAGDNIGFAIGHFGGRALVLRFGRYVRVTAERLDKTESFFNRHGGKIIVVARFVEGLRQLNGIIAGISGMHWLRFVAFNALGAALWVGTWVSLGDLAGNHLNTIYHYLTEYSWYLLIAVVVLLAGYIVRRVVRLRSVGREAHQPQETSGTQEDAGTHDRVGTNGVRSGAGGITARRDAGENGTHQDTGEHGTHREVGEAARRRDTEVRTDSGDAGTRAGPGEDGTKRALGEAAVRRDSGVNPQSS